MPAAADFGAVEVMIWARESGCLWEKAYPPELPPSSGSMAMHTQYTPSSYTSIRAAAKGGHTRFVEVAKEMGCEWGPHPMYDAARHGHLTTLQRMHELGCPINAMVAYGAARDNQPAVMRWLQSVGAPMQTACEGAADRILDDGLPIAKLQEALQETLDVGGILSANVATSLLQESTDILEDSEFLKWLLEHGLELSDVGPFQAGAIWYGVLSNNCADELKLLRRNGLPWHPFALVAAIECLPEELLICEWMIENGCPVSGRAMYAAVSAAAFELCEFCIHAF